MGPGVRTKAPFANLMRDANLMTLTSCVTSSQAWPSLVMTGSDLCLGSWDLRLYTGVVTYKEGSSWAHTLLRVIAVTHKADLRALATYKALCSMPA